MRRRKSWRLLRSRPVSKIYLIKAACLAAFFLPIAGCTSEREDAVQGGGLEPPPGFLTQADADCRAAASDAGIKELGEDTTETRQLNGQTLLTYAAEGSRKVLCSVRHADGQVLDVRTFGEATEGDISEAPVSWQTWTEACKKWDNWNKPAPPFHIHGDTYHVGTCGISALLVTGSEGHVLIDAGTKVGARHVAENVAALGFDMTDVEILLSSHEHHDHVGGLADLQRSSGATVVASKAAAPVLESGQLAASDPQYGMHDPFDPVPVGRVIEAGDVVELGSLSFTAIATPGHTDGALSWQWESCEDQSCETIVFADSLSPVSRDDYRFSDYPERLTAYRNGLNELAEADCTLLLTPHPSASLMRDRLEAGQLTEEAPCVNYAQSIGIRLERRLAKEAAQNSEE